MVTRKPPTWTCCARPARQILGFSLFLLGCQARVSEMASPVLPSSARVSASAPVPRPSHPWQSAQFIRRVSLGQWQTAQLAFDEAYPAPDLPELRFVRARIAVELGDNLRAAALLQGLAAQLPVLSQEVAELLARSAADAGSQKQAASYYADQTGPSARLNEARARMHAGEMDAAKRLYDTVLAQKNIAPALVAEALRDRAELAHVEGDRAAADRYLTQLALSYPTSDAAVELEAILRQFSPATVFTKRQRYVRVQAFAEAGNFERFSAELRLLNVAPGPAVARVELQRTTALANYKSRRDYAQAARLFEQCAAEDGAQRDKDAFYAARAWSRAHHDDTALRGYERITRAFPKSGYALQARYHAARLHYIHGRWAEAVRGYDIYLKRAGKRAGVDAEAASYERGVALVAAGASERSVIELTALAQQASGEREEWLLRHLLGVAQLQRGNAASAQLEFRAVLEQQPLSFAALLSAARLRAMGENEIAEMPPATVEPQLPQLDVALPEKVELLASLGLDRDAEGELTRQATQFSTAFEPRAGEALCLAYGQLNGAESRYRHALKVVRERAVLRAMSPGTEWLWDCLYPAPYRSTVAELETELQLPAGLLFGVMRQESAFAPEVRSGAGALGLMQLMPKTAERLASALELPFEPRALKTPGYNLMLGARYLSRLLSRFQGNVALAAAAYNAGPSAVLRWLGHTEALPLDLFVAHIIYGETRTYVQRVVGNWARYRYMAEGTAAIPRLELGLPKNLTADEQDY